MVVMLAVVIVRRHKQFLHTEVCSHRNLYKEKFFHIGAFTHKAFAQRSLGSFYGQKLQQTDAFTRRSFDTEKSLNRVGFTHRRVYTECFTHRHIYTQKRLHPEALH